MTRIEQEDCPTHCYAPKEREAIREVMRRFLEEQLNG